MELTDEMVDRIAALAKLSFTAEEREEIRQDLARMIGFVDQLRALDLDGVPPLTHLSDTSGPGRDDIAGVGTPPASALQNAPSVSGPYFTVPKFIQR